jgi:hypothetical protein
MASQKSSKSKTPKDPYFKHPKFLKQWHEALLKNRWLRGGILAAILISLSTGLVVLAFRIWEPPAISKLIPDTTVKFVTKADTGGTSFLDGVGDQVGMVWFGEGGFPQLQFYTIRDQVMVENELIAEQAIKYSRLFENYFVVGDSEASLSILDDVKRGSIPSLHTDPDFIKMRPNLSYRPDSFEYIQTPLIMREDAYEFFYTQIPRRDWLDAPIDYLFSYVFTTTGTTFENGFQKSYIVGDKSLMEGEALFHLEEKYKGNLLEKLPLEISSLYAGQDLVTTTNQFIELLDGTDGVSGKILEGLIADKLHHYLPNDVSVEESLGKLFNNEYAYAGTETGAKILLLELDDDSPADELVGQFEAHGITEINSVTGNLRSIPVEFKRSNHDGTEYHSFIKTNGDTVFAFAVIDDILILTTEITEMEQTIDSFQNNAKSYADTPGYGKLEPLLSSSDHLQIIKRKATGINLFDDGVIRQQVSITPSE